MTIEGVPTLEAVRARRDEIERIAAEYGASNIRVFGSVARGDARRDSDIDFLIDLLPGERGWPAWGLAGLGDDLERLLGRKVDVVMIFEPSRIAERILREAVPLSADEATGDSVPRSVAPLTDEERDVALLEYIHESAELVREFTRGGESVFYRDRLVQDGIMGRLESLAGATNNLSDALQARHPEIPWRRIADFRNHVAQDYMAIDLDLVWSIISESLPLLDAAVVEELKSLE